MRSILIELLLALVLLPLSGLFWWWVFGMGSWAVLSFLLLAGLMLFLVLRGIRANKARQGRHGDAGEQ